MNSVYNKKDCYFCFKKVVSNFLSFENFCVKCLKYALEYEGSLCIDVSNTSLEIINNYCKYNVKCTNCEEEVNDSFKFVCCESHLPE